MLLFLSFETLSQSFTGEIKGEVKYKNEFLKMPLYLIELQFH